MKRVCDRRLTGAGNATKGDDTHWHKNRASVQHVHSPRLEDERHDGSPEGIFDCITGNARLRDGRYRTTGSNRDAVVLSKWMMAS